MYCSSDFSLALLLCSRYSRWMKLQYILNIHSPSSVSIHSGNLDKPTGKGNTALHYCCIYNKPECLKLLLRGKPTIDLGEESGHARSVIPIP